MKSDLLTGATARIVLRYIVGGFIAGSPALGKELASDPDLVLFVSGGIAFGAAGVGAAVEWFYAQAKKRGWKL